MKLGEVAQELSTTAVGNIGTCFGGAWLDTAQTSPPPPPPAFCPRVRSLSFARPFLPFISFDRRTLYQLLHNTNGDLISGLVNHPSLAQRKNTTAYLTPSHLEAAGGVLDGVLRVGRSFVDLNDAPHDLDLFIYCRVFCFYIILNNRALCFPERRGGDETEGDGKQVTKPKEAVEMESRISVGEEFSRYIHGHGLGVKRTEVQQQQKKSATERPPSTCTSLAAAGLLHRV